MISDIPKYTVIKYLRDKNGNPRGCLVAVKLPEGRPGTESQPISVHYSYCRKEDKFTKNMALKIAINRAYMNTGSTFTEIPRQVRKEIDAFNRRVEKYFRVKPEQICTW